MADSAEHVHRPKAQRQDPKKLGDNQKGRLEPQSSMILAMRTAGQPRQSARLFSYRGCSCRLTLMLVVWSAGCKPSREAVSAALGIGNEVHGLGGESYLSSGVVNNIHYAEKQFLLDLEKVRPIPGKDVSDDI